MVGSGDLEVLLSPVADTRARAQWSMRTSVDGYGHVWKSVLDRFFTRYDGAAQIEINDFGATPGVVMLRLAEAVEAAEAGDDAWRHAHERARHAVLARHSFIELPARERARALLDPGTLPRTARPVRPARIAVARDAEASSARPTTARDRARHASTASPP